MSRLAGAFHIMRCIARSTSRGSRVRATVPNPVGRLIAVIAVFVLGFAAHTSNRLEPAGDPDAFRSATPAAALSAFHALASHRIATSGWRATRPATGVHAALPAVPQAVVVRLALRGGTNRAFADASVAVTGRGSDATAPPALT